MRDRAAAIVFAYDHGIVDPHPQGEPTSDPGAMRTCERGAPSFHDHMTFPTDDAAAAPAPGDPLVQVRDLRPGYGTTEVLRGISFDVRRGGSFGLLGM